MANIALLLLVFVLATFIAQAEVFRKRVIAVLDVGSRINVTLVIIFLRTTALALKAMLTFPFLRNMLNLWGETERMIRSVASSTEHQVVFVSCFAADFARFAVQAFPIRLIHSIYLIRGQL